MPLPAPPRRFASAVLAVTAALIAAMLPPSSPASAVPVACGWPVYIGADGLNVLAPDYQANYWILHYEAIPGTALRIEGTYPDARFFSHTIQDEKTITTAALADRDIAPLRPGTNPYADRGAAPGAAYSLRVVFEDVPAGGPEQNTIYAGRTYEDEPNPGGTLIYRVYVATDQDDPLAGQPLPKIVQETPAGDIDLSFEQCQGAGGGLDGPANSSTADADRPLDIPGLVPTSAAYRAKPNFTRIFAGFFTDPVTQSVPGGLGDHFPTPDGTPLANAPFPYLASNLSRQYGALAVVRFKAPSFPDTVAGESVTKKTQSRYWSLCSYAAIEEGGLRGNACLTDFQVKPNRRGFVTFVISDRAHRPTAFLKSKKRGVYALPWGPWDKTYLLMRIGLPAESWKNSPLRIDENQPNQARAAASAMGSYYPVARYCTAKVIERRGLGPCFGD
jgi:hypothetical protein